MPVRQTNLISVARKLHGENLVKDMNVAAQAHVTWSQFLAPVDKGNLRKAIRQTKEATEGDPVAIVQAGGIEVDGVYVDYAAAVNYGSSHTSPSGTTYSIPAQPFWEDGEDVAKQTLARRAKERRSASRSSRRAFTETSFKDLVG